MDKKDYSAFSATDFAVDRAFMEWVKTNDPELQKFWNEWANKNPAKKKDLETARSLVLALQFKEHKVADSEINDAWMQVKPSVRESVIPDYRKVQSYGSRLKAFMRMAAMLIMVSSIGLVIYLMSDQAATPGPSMVVKETPKGQKLTVSLPDGTQINLNSDSRIEFPSRFTGGIREVLLEGEAYFDVEHNINQPFVVRSGDISTIVLGTSFNVNAYADSPEIQVALVEGKVRVESDQAVQNTVTLNPDEMAVISKESLEIEVSVFNQREIVGWKDGYLYFEKVAFSDIIERLERWYGVDFEISKEAAINSDWRFNGKFQNKSLEYILGVFSYPDLFHYKIEDDKVIIY